jgi:hypothetical protein
MSDILDGLAQMHAAFMRENLKPPTVMLLESHEQGMRFLRNIRQSSAWTAVAGSPDLGRAVEMADGSAWMECKVMGIAVRWPANRIAIPDGGWFYAKANAPEIAELKESYALLFKAHGAALAMAETNAATIDRLHDRLRQIGDRAHGASTGPAEPDVLWEIRGMAYDGIGA